MPASPYVSRVNQIDAAQLDEEIYKVLKNQVNEITKYQPVGKADKWQPEIDALLKIVIWNFSLRHGKSTFGQDLLNLHYANITKTKSVLYLLLTVLPAYLRDKLADHRFSSDQPYLRNVKSIVDTIASVARVVELVNILVFLNRGTKPRVVENLVGISSSPIKTHQARNIGYSYMTRELVWHGLIEFFTVGLPLVNFHYLKQLAKRMFQGSKKPGLQRSQPVMSSATRCAYCNERPILPAHAGCEHLFCYYCLKAHFVAMNAFQCPECATELRASDMKDYLAMPESSSEQQQQQLPQEQLLDS